MRPEVPPADAEQRVRLEHAPRGDPVPPAEVEAVVRERAVVHPVTDDRDDAEQDDATRADRVREARRGPRASRAATRRATPARSPRANSVANAVRLCVSRSMTPRRARRDRDASAPGEAVAVREPLDRDAGGDDVSSTMTAAKLLGDTLKPIISPPTIFRSNCWAWNESGSQSRSLEDLLAVLLPDRAVVRQLDEAVDQPVREVREQQPEADAGDDAQPQPAPHELRRRPEQRRARRPVLAAPISAANWSAPTRSSATAHSASRPSSDVRPRPAEHVSRGRSAAAASTSRAGRQQSRSSTSDVGRARAARDGVAAGDDVERVAERLEHRRPRDDERQRQHEREPASARRAAARTSTSAAGGACRCVGRAVELRHWHSVSAPVLGTLATAWLGVVSGHRRGAHLRIPRSSADGSGCCSSSATTPRISSVWPKISIAANVDCTCGSRIAAIDVAAVTR